MYMVVLWSCLFVFVVDMYMVVLLSCLLVFVVEYVHGCSMVMCVCICG